MRKKLLLSAFALAGLVLPFTGVAHAATVRPACVAGNIGPVHLQLGYAPHGPADCTRLP